MYLSASSEPIAKQRPAIKKALPTPPPKPRVSLEESKTPPLRLSQEALPVALSLMNGRREGQEETYQSGEVADVNVLFSSLLEIADENDLEEDYGQEEQAYSPHAATEDDQSESIVIHNYARTGEFSSPIVGQEDEYGEPGETLYEFSVSAETPILPTADAEPTYETSMILTADADELMKDLQQGLGAPKNHAPQAPAPRSLNPTQSNSRWLSPAEAAHRSASKRPMLVVGSAPAPVAATTTKTSAAVPRQQAPTPPTKTPFKKAVSLLQKVRSPRPSSQGDTSDTQEMAAVGPSTSHAISAPTIAQSYKTLPKEDPVSSFQRTFLNAMGKLIEARLQEIEALNCHDDKLVGMCIEKIMYHREPGLDDIRVVGILKNAIKTLPKAEIEKVVAQYAISTADWWRLYYAFRKKKQEEFDANQEQRLVFDDEIQVTEKKRALCAEFIFFLTDDNKLLNIQ